MAEKSENPALVMLLRLEARVDGLAQELHRVKGRLAYVESRLAQLETEYGAMVAPNAGIAGEPSCLDIPGIAPPLSAGEDEDAIVELVRQIWARRTCVHVLSDEERAALEEAWREGVVSQEEVAAFLKRRGIG
ncbi:MAG: hypothetical protein J2P53_03135 [Bradyrhizobiaceae bacterium]|nr:hypothetical protein [Bradyrhizobiaceae bacterium]